MRDSPEMTKNLLDMYGRNNLISRLNLKCFLQLSGLYNISRDSKILDCGCGRGRIIRTLQAAGFKNIIGLDAAYEMVEMARKSTGASVIHAVALEIEKIFKHNDFDVIIASNVIHHLGTICDWKVFLRGCNRILKEGGGACW